MQQNFLRGKILQKRQYSFSLHNFTLLLIILNLEKSYINHFKKKQAVHLQKSTVSVVLPFLMFKRDAQQGCTYLIENTVKTIIFLFIIIYTENSRSA